MTLDPDQRIAIIGTPGNGDVIAVEQTDGGGLRLPLGVGRTVAFSIPAVAACGAAAIYDDLSFIVDASGHAVGDAVTGSGRPTGLAAAIDLSVTMVLDRRPGHRSPDVEPDRRRRSRRSVDAALARGV